MAVAPGVVSSASGGVGWENDGTTCDGAKTFCVMPAQALITLTQLKNPWNVTELLTALHAPCVITHVTSSGNCEEKCVGGPQNPYPDSPGSPEPQL